MRERRFRRANTTVGNTINVAHGLFLFIIRIIAGAKGTHSLLVTRSRLELSELDGKKLPFLITMGRVLSDISQVMGITLVIKFIGIIFGIIKSRVRRDRGLE